MMFLLLLAFYITCFVSAQSSGFLPPFANSTAIAVGNRTSSTLRYTPTIRTSSTLETSTTLSATSSAASSPTPSTLSCPSSNNTLYTATSGQTFIVECDIDHERGDLDSVQVESLEACIAVCDDTKGCLDVSLSGSACYLKSLLGKPLPAKGLLGARLQSATTPISCPEDSGSNYTTHSGKIFAVECGIDYEGGDMGSLSMDGVGELWLQECAESCGNVTGCVDVSLSGSACYLKSSLGAAQSNSGIVGARLISPLPATATSAIASPTPTPDEICDIQSPTCPACNNTILYSEDGEESKPFRIECGIDRPGGDMASQDNEHTGLRGPRAFRNCLEDCAEAEGCVDVTLLGDTCYLKDVLKGAVSQPLALGARLLE